MKDRTSALCAIWDFIVLEIPYAGHISALNNNFLFKILIRKFPTKIVNHIVFS